MPNNRPFIPVVAKIDSEKHSVLINEKIIQGMTFWDWTITIMLRGNAIQIPQTAKITVYIIQNPKRDSTGKLINPQGFQFDSTDVNNGIVVNDITTTRGTVSTITIPFKPEFVHAAGQNEMIIAIEGLKDGDTTVSYTGAIIYEVQLNDAYQMKIGSNLQTFEELAKKLADLDNNKLGKDFKGLTDEQITNIRKVLKVPDEVKSEDINDLVSGLAQNKLVELKKTLGIKDITGDDIVTLLTNLIGDKRLPFSVLKDPPTISGLPSADEILKAFNDVKFKEKAENAGLLTDDLGNVDEDGMNEKINKSELAKTVKLLGEDLTAFSSALDKKADSDIKNVKPEDLSNQFRLTGAYAELYKRTGDNSKVLHYLEEQQAIADWSTIPQKELNLAYQFTSNNQTINQVLPPLSENRYIVINNIIAGFTGCKLILTANTGEQIDGSSLPITLTGDGIQGMLVPSDNNNYEWIPYPVLHENGIVVSDENGNIDVGTKNLKFKGAAVSNENGDTVVTIESGELEFVGPDGQVITGKKLTSNSGKVRFFKNLDGSVDVDVLESGADGILCELKYNENINTDFHDQALYMTPVISHTGMYIGFDKINKGFTHQYGGPKDPNTIQDSIAKIGYNLEFEDNPIAQSDGYIEIKLVNNLNGQAALDPFDAPIIARREYKTGDRIDRLFLLSSINDKGQSSYTFKVDTNLTGQVLVASGKSCYYVQAVTEEASTGLAEIGFMLRTGIRREDEVRYYGYNIMNLAQTLVKAKGEAELNNAYERMGNGLFIDSRALSKVSISNYHITMQNDGINVPVFSLGKIFDKLDTYTLRNKVLNAKVTIQDKDCAYDYALMKWTGQGEATLPILTGFQNVVTPTFATGWELVSKKFISEDAVVGDHVDTNAFTVPDDAVQIAVIIYPIVSQAPTTMILKDFELDVSPQFQRTFISSSYHISEEYFRYDKYAYRSLVKTPRGDASYRYTFNMAWGKVPVGVVDGGDGKLINDNSWTDIGSSDPNKTQGNLKALVDMEVTISTLEMRAKNEKTTPNDAQFKLVKIDTQGTETDITQFATTIPASNVVKMVRNPAPIKFNLKTGESFGLRAKSNLDDGFYLVSELDGVPMVKFEIDVKELLPIPNEITNQLELLDKVVIVDDDGKEVAGKRIEINAKTGQLRVVDK